MTSDPGEAAQADTDRLGSSWRLRDALLAIVALGLALRSLIAPLVFVDPETVVFVTPDPYFHAYRALASLESFPRFLSFDPYTNFPDGAVLPAPPLYDLLVAGLTRLAGGGPALLERIAAWLPPLIAALTAIPVFVAGRVIGGTSVALGGAALFAFLPANANTSMVGYADHHAAVGFLAATWLAIELLLLAPGRRASSLRLFAGLAITRAALVLTWSGSLLYLGLGDGIFVCIAALASRRDLLAGQAASAALSAAGILPFVGMAATPTGGAFSAVELSGLHVAICLGIAVWAGALVPGTARTTAPAPHLGRRIAELVGAGLVVGLVVLVVSGAWTDLAVALRFVGKTDQWGQAVLEQAPLFSSRAGTLDGFVLFGALAFFVPVAPLAALLAARDPQMRPAAAALGIWGAVLGALTLLQNRFAGELAAPVSILFALALVHGTRWVRARGGPSELRLRVALAVLLVGLLQPAVSRFYVPAGALSAQIALGQLPPLDRALFSPYGSALRFARMVRRLTPPTSGFLRPDVAPEYALISDANLGHIFQYVARRPTVVNNFGPYIGRRNLEAVDRFFGPATDDEAFAIAQSLGGRYVITAIGRSDDPDWLLNRLHREDGSATPRHSASGHFRLVTEGPAHGIPFATTFRALEPDLQLPAYKLFEVVDGAVLEVDAPRGQVVTAEIGLRTPLGRHFVWSAQARCSDAGTARLRLPYATQGRQPTRADGPYRVRVGSEEHVVDVAEEHVQTGQTLRLDRALR